MVKAVKQHSAIDTTTTLWSNYQKECLCKRYFSIYFWTTNINLNLCLHKHNQTTAVVIDTALEIEELGGCTTNKHANIQTRVYLERSAGVDMGVHSFCVPVVAVVTAQCLEVLSRGAGNDVQDQITNVGAMHAVDYTTLLN